MNIYHRSKLTSAEISNDDTERSGFVAGRFLLFDSDPGLHQAMFGRHKRYVRLSQLCIGNILIMAEEEIFDTVLLVIRNAVQFLRLGNILRR